MIAVTFVPWVTLERTQEKCLIMVKLFSSFEFFAVVKQVLLLWGLCFAAR